MNNDFNLQTDIVPLVKQEQFEQYKTETKDFLRLMKTDNYILQDKITQTKIEVRAELKQLKRHLYMGFFSISFVLLTAIAYQLYIIFTK